MRLITFTFGVVLAALVAPVASQEYQEMRWKGSNKCMTASTQPGSDTRVFLSQCTGADSQLWAAPDSFDGGVLTLKAPLAPKGGNYCLALEALENGSPAVMVTCYRYMMRAGWWNPNENNKLIELARRTIIGSTPGHFGYCIDVTEGNPADGTRLQGWQCYADNPNQQWVWGGITSSNPPAGSC